MITRYRINREYSHVLSLIERYPLDREIKELYLDLKHPERAIDMNDWIRNGSFKNEKALNEIIKREEIQNNPQIKRLIKQQQVMNQAISEITPEEWRFLKAVYGDRKTAISVEQASGRYLYVSARTAYERVIRPFCERVNDLIWD